MVVVKPVDAAVIAAEIAASIASIVTVAELLAVIFAVVIFKVFPSASTRSKLILPSLVAGVVTVMTLLAKAIDSPFPE